MVNGIDSTTRKFISQRWFIKKWNIHGWQLEGSPHSFILMHLSSLSSPIRDVMSPKFYLEIVCQRELSNVNEKFIPSLEDFTWSVWDFQWMPRHEAITVKHLKRQGCEFTQRVLSLPWDGEDHVSIRVLFSHEGRSLLVLMLLYADCSYMKVVGFI